MDKREEIIKSAKDLVLMKGYNNVSVEDITNHIGIAKGSFYTYFKSKTSLINYILEEKIRNSEQEQKKFFRSVKTFEGAIRKLVRSKIILKGEEDIKIDLMITSFFRNIDSLDEDTIKILIEIEKLNVDFVEKILIRYGDDINIKDGDIRFYSKFVNGIIHNYKIFNLFISEEKNDFITTTQELKEKYQDKKFNNNVKIIIESIKKILR